jgi:hypothetical protein
MSNLGLHSTKSLIAKDKLVQFYQGNFSILRYKYYTLDHAVKEGWAVSPIK